MYDHDAFADIFEAHRASPEAIYDLPTLAGTLRVRIAAAGGGEVGEAYADNYWLYEVSQDGLVVAEGSDLRSGGIPKTHREMAKIAAEYVEDVLI